MQAAGCIGVPSDLSALAEMGSCGQHSNSMHRDLMALVKDDSQLPQPFFGVSPLQEAACGTSNHVASLGFSCLVGKLQTILGNSFFFAWRQGCIAQLLEAFCFPPLHGWLQRHQ